MIVYIVTRECEDGFYDDNLATKEDNSPAVFATEREADEFCINYAKYNCYRTNILKATI